MSEHEPVLYRTDRQDRHGIPAEVCGTCSDFEEGRLVPVSFCDKSNAVSTTNYIEQDRGAAEMMKRLVARGLGGER